MTLPSHRIHRATMLRDVSLLLRFRPAGRSSVEVVVSPGKDRRCCWPVDSRKDWLDVGPGNRVYFPKTEETLTVESVAVHGSLPPILGTGHGLKLYFAMTGRELVGRIGVGEFVDWPESGPPAWNEVGRAAAV